METLTMSMQERRRLAVLERVETGEMALGEAAARLGLSYRQMRRVRDRFRREGDRGLVHRLRGRRGNRSIDASVREQALALYAAHYSDFGPTLASEYLSERHGIVVQPKTLGRWLIHGNLWRRQRRSSKKRRRRERRACFGELVQVDGSPHAWFEERGERCVLMAMIDDATGWTVARFFPAETREAAMTIFQLWAEAHGLPAELYPDQASIYRVNTEAADEQEARTGKRPRTQFGRAMDELGVKLTCAKSPQAKGRVERLNGTLQDRLIKAMRIEGISTIEAANAYLEQTFLPQFNARFAVAPAEEADRHLPVTKAALAMALCVREQRTVGQDQCVSWRNQAMQLKPGRKQPSLAGKQVTVREGLDGELRVLYRGQAVAWQAVKQPMRTAAAKPSLAERVAEHQAPWKPSATHPWQ